MAKSFNKAAAKPAARPAPNVKTAAELKNLRATRPKPTPKPALKPKGPIVARVHKAVEKKREARIKELRSSLKGSTTRLRWGQAHAQNKDKAKSQFMKSR